jgi:WxL domain surface cell wall-binding
VRGASGLWRDPGCNARRLLTILAAVIGCTALLAGGPSRASAASLASATWTASTTTASAAGASYTYTMMTATGGPLTTVTMTVPSGTGGTPAVGTVTPAAIAGGAVSLVGMTLSYTVSSVSVPAGIVLSIQVTGLTNTASTGTATSVITTVDGATAVDTATADFTFTATALTGAGWTTSSAVVGAADTSYTYTFQASSVGGTPVTTIAMSIPPGTAGTPAIGTVTPPSLASSLNTVTLSGTTLTVTGSAVPLASSIPASIQVTGLTNTYTAGRYVPEIVTSNAGGLVDSGVASADTFPGALVVTAPSSLSWSGTLNGSDQAIPDTDAAAEQLSVNDQTDSGAGWHVSVSATSFTNGAGYSLPATGVLQVAGSVASEGLTTAPTASCQGTLICTLPDDSSVSYPVAITSAAQSPAAVTVYAASAGTGVGPVSIGGAGTSNPLGWWLNVPATALAGTYTSTVTISVVSGP